MSINPGKDKNSKKIEKGIKVAIVHDFLTTDGGAEKVLRAFHEIWPQAPVFTVTYSPEKFNPPLDGWDIRSSFVARLPFRKVFEDQYKLFYQLAAEKFDLHDFDLVISSTWAGYAKGVLVAPGSKHFCYVHTVPRFLWGFTTAKHGRLNFFWKLIMPPLEHFWRIWDRQTVERPDEMIANSREVASRIRKFYRREAHVIYPPVETILYNKVTPESGKYFLYFGRLEAYKRVDIAIEACAKAGVQLKIVGTGSGEKELKKIAETYEGKAEVEFLGRVDDEGLVKLVGACKAVLVPCPDEDFGITPVEAMAAGKPVIAFDSGGVRESVVDGETGVLVKEFGVDQYAEAIRKFRAESFDPEKCRERAQLFSKQVFIENFSKFVRDHYEA
jgi:glycosyltransferase involved in cell wall biosynthesis